MMPLDKKKGLGKGLGALFTDGELNVPVQPETLSTAKKAEHGVIYIGINEIRPNANQPRKLFNESMLDELANSIEEHGVIKPIIVRSAENGYELVAGERRWRAARKAGLKVIPCIIREISDEENILFALIENMQREDLNPIEEAEGIQHIIELFNLTQEEIAKSLGKSRPYIANAIRLLRLQENVKDYLLSGELTSGHGKAIASVADKDKQQRLADYIVQNKCSVRETESLAEDPKFEEPKKRPKPRAKNNDILTIEEELRTIMGTKVIINNLGDRGKIEIVYYSREELDGIIEILRSLK
jgi:ParB family chromosome partitioning protein